ncbi:Sialic acid-binding Ig-like lectin 10 [Camelus dromedarius]|uniref:Sialic acid-binding Ig-like lectin 10 n=1 Tax=Camelus dromedarius TaxID=9838 RepID=A0A5N4DS11_CAMDR|nr:Sialic acid-binding Ig-like lectin 10 [Camelus dromedarius]
MLSWFRRSLSLSPCQPLDPGVLELPHVVLGDRREFTCRTQHPGSSHCVSLNLVVQGCLGSELGRTSCSCPQVSGEQQGTWPLVLTLLRGSLMGAGFLLTYGLTWIYYTRPPGYGHRAAQPSSPGSGGFLTSTSQDQLSDGLTPAAHKVPGAWRSSGQAQCLTVAETERYFKYPPGLSFRLLPVPKASHSVLPQSGSKMLLPLLVAVLWGGSGALYPKFQLQVPKFVSVQEGLCVVVSCSLITYPPRGWTHATPAHGYWFRDPANTHTDPPVATNKPDQKVRKDTQGRFQLLGNLSQSCSLLIRDVQMEDAASYFFRLERGSYVQYNFKENMFYLEVTALELWGNSPHLEVQKGQFLRLLCAADSLPLATLSWALEDRVLSWSHPSGSRTLELVLPGVKAEDAGRYTCQAENRLGAQSRSLDLSVQYAPENLRVVVSQANRTDPPQLLGPSCSWEDQGLHCSCSSRAQPAPSLRWRLGEGLLEGTSSNASYMVNSSSAGPWANSSLSLSEGLSSGLSLSCEAQNVHGAQSARVLLLPGEKKLLSKGVFVAIGLMTLLFLCLIPIACPGPKASTQDADYENNQEELHYAVLNFPGHRPWETQGSKDAHSDYAEIQLH